MLKDKLHTLPLQPGCYLMKDKNGEVIYVGKAKKLKNRVSSYFVGSHNNKTTKLVSNIVDFDYIVTPSEKEALILEYNLIKQYKPRFNISFMDDSSYPYIRLSKEDYPTLALVRDRRRMKNAIYFGPYPNVGYARELLELLNKLYPLRKCKNMPDKICLYYHLNVCLGPCQFKIDKQIYQELTEKIIAFINGDTKTITKEIKNQRDKFSENLEFEKANEAQKLLLAIEHVTSNQIMQANSSKATEDVFNYYVDKGYIAICGLLYSDGKLLHTHKVLKPIYDEIEDTFVSYIVQYYNNKPLGKYLLLPEGIETLALQEVLATKILQPQKGNKKRLIELAKENAKINLDQKFAIINAQEQDNQQALQQLQKLLSCATTRIELFDISHTAGTLAVGSQVVYIDGEKSKKDYRLYKVNNENNDMANMQEVLYRRLFSAIQNNTVLPDIIIVDGGVSQITAAKEIINSLELDNVKVVGLVKNDKHQTSNLMDEDFSILPIDRESSLFYLLTNMQDEVHRSAITFHKSLRSKQLNKSPLDEINGIGLKRRQRLLRTFGSITKIKAATIEELSKVVPNDIAKNIYEYFRREI